MSPDQLIYKNDWSMKIKVHIIFFTKKPNAFHLSVSLKVESQKDYFYWWISFLAIFAYISSGLSYFNAILIHFTVYI